MSASTAPSPSSSTPFSPKSSSPPERPRRSPLPRSYSSSSNSPLPRASPSPSASSPPAQQGLRIRTGVQSLSSPSSPASGTFAGPSMMAFASSSGLNTSHFASTRHTLSPPASTSYQAPSHAFPRRCSATAALGLAAVADRQAVIAAARRTHIPRRLSAPPVPDFSMPTTARTSPSSSAQAVQAENKTAALSSPVLPSKSLTAMSASPPRAEPQTPEATPDPQPVVSGLASASAAPVLAPAARGSISLTPAQRAAIAQLLLQGLSAESQPSGSGGRPPMTNSASFHVAPQQARRDTADRIRAAFAQRPSIASDPAHSSSAVNAAAAAAQLGLLAARTHRTQSTSTGSGSSLLVGVQRAAARRATLASGSRPHGSNAQQSHAAADSSENESEDEHASAMQPPQQRLEAPHRFAGGEFSSAPFQASVVRRESTHISPFAMAPSSLPPRPHVSWQDRRIVTTAPALPVPQRTHSSPPILADAPAAAHEWAAYYAREQAWAGAALEQEARRHSGGTDDGSRARRDSRVPGVFGRRPSTAGADADPFGEGPSAKRPRWGSGDSSVVASTRRNTHEAYRTWDAGRTPSLSLTRPSDDEASASASPAPPGENQGLVGVLSNFANLLEARQETCEGLESLARQAHTLGQIPLMPLGSGPSTMPPHMPPREESDGEQ